MPTLDVTYKHPELRDGEVFLTNVAGETVYFQIGYKTKRRGIVAYDVRDQPIPRMYPVFVSKEEYNANIRQAKEDYTFYPDLAKLFKEVD